MLRRASSLSALALALVLAAPAARGAPLLTGFGGPLGYGTNTLPPNDDGFSDQLDLTPAFPGGLQSFASTYTRFWVNNNGNISFTSGLYEFTPTSFPVASQPMIAPWWGDVDTRGGSTQPNQNSVWWYVERGRVVVTWSNVGYYGSHTDRLNSFQLILSEDPACPGVGNFDVEFRYARCEWTTGDASGGSGGLGGTPAQAGFDAGNLRDYYALPGSLTAGILDVCTTHNGTGIPGDWLFSVCNGNIVGGCPGGGSACTVAGQRGVCAQGLNRCAGMGSTECVQVRHAGAETCNGLDDDCNGAVDDGIAPQVCYEGPAGTQGVGVCVGGARPCAGGVFGACQGQVLPSAESCDNLDNDCNGRVDDLAPRECYPGAAGNAGVGVCRRGAQRCAAGAWGGCEGYLLPSAEVCDGLDNDCDGAVDNGLVGCMPEPLPEPVPEPPPEAGVEAGVDAALDGAREAAVVNRCGGDPHCDYNLRLGGRAGPLGCQCSAAVGSAGRSRSRVAIALLGALGMTLSRRRRRGR